MPLQQDRLGSDGLPVLVQKPHSMDKLYFVAYFAALFSGGMKNKWATRAYVDLFAGPGMCLDDTTGKEFDGSPLRALGCRTPFTHLFFNDINSKFVEALTQRQERLFPDAEVRYYNLDCNEAVSPISRDLPRGALVLAFIDPWTYEITFDAIAALTKDHQIDLIVTFHSTPIKRAAHLQIAAVDKFLDDTDWRKRYWAAQGDFTNPPTKVLIDTFQKGLSERLRYRFFGDPEVIKNTMEAPMYYLLFASRNRTGLDFWEKSSLRNRGGQRTMF